MKNHTTKPEPASFPVYITGEPTKITVYKKKDIRGRDRFVVAYYDAAQRRHRRRCKSYQQAELLSEKVAKEIKKGGWDVLALSGAERHAYERAKSLLRPTGIPIDVAVQQFVDAQPLLKGCTVMEAARAYSNRPERQVVFKTVEEALVELIEDRRERGRGKVYIRDLRNRLGSFAHHFHCPLATICTADIDQYLRSLKTGPVFKNNVLEIIGTLFNFGKSRGYVAADHPGISGVGRYDAKPNEISVFTPEEMTALLQAANPAVQTALALTSFAGVRGAELMRLDWSDINFDGGFIRVPASKAKTGVRRVPPIPDNLRAWLMLHRKSSGRVVPYENVYNQFPKCAELAGVLWKRNAARHSFASYRTMLIKNVQQVAFESGNTPAMIYAHYFQLVTEADARKWFAVAPNTIPGLP